MTKLRGCSLMMVLLLATAFGSAATPPPENVCVPADGGGWNCGNTAAPPPPAALPAVAPSAVSGSSSPPLLLIDPKRFQLQSPDAAPIANVQPEPESAPPPPAVPEPVPEPVAVPAPQPVHPSVAYASGLFGNAEFQSLTPGQFTLQLAAAGSPDGFAALLARLQAPHPAWQLRVQRGAQSLWLLCLGTFADAASARAAVPPGSAGAFPKPVAQLQLELASP